MTPGAKLKLGTIALQAQTAEPAPIAIIARPEQIASNTAVWIYFRRWRRGRVMRIIETNPRLVRKGRPLGAWAVVLLEACAGLTVRRRLKELLPVSAVGDTPPYMPFGQDNRKSAQSLADSWWADHEYSLH